MALFLRDDYGFMDIMIPQSIDDHAFQDDWRPTVLHHQMVKLLPEPVQYGHVELIGVLWNGAEVLHQHHNTMTRLWRSPLSLTEPSDSDVFQPCALFDGDTRLPYYFDPFQNGADKFNHEFVDIDEPLADLCIEHVAEYYADLSFRKQFACRKMTKTEAINGISLFKTSSPLSRDTSAGFPWSQMRGVTKKGSFFDFDTTRQIWVLADSVHGRLLNDAVDANENAIRHGKRIAIVNIATLKDEPRKLKRIYDKPDTRVFYASPLDVVMLMRMYFHTASCCITETHRETPIKIGINPSGIDFHVLFENLTSVGDDAFDLDASGWDSTLPPYVIGQLYKIYNRIYEVCDPLAERNPKLFEEQQNIRRRLRDHLTHPLVAYHDFVACYHGGNISGQTTTGLDNSLVNFVLSYYVYHKIVEQHHNRIFLQFSFFMSNVGLAIYGDDSVVVVSPALNKIVTPLRWIEGFRDVGISLTSADKLSDVEVVFKPVAQCQFLKRNFVRSERPNRTPGMITGALEMDVFYKMLDYCMSGKAHDFFREPDVMRYDIRQMQSTAGTALLESANHGRQFFELMRAHLRRRSREFDLGIELFSYSQAFDIIWNVETTIASQLEDVNAEEEEDLLFNVFTPDESPFEPHCNMSAPSKPQPAVVGEKGGPSETGNHPKSSGGFDAA